MITHTLHPSATLNRKQRFRRTAPHRLARWRKGWKEIAHAAALQAMRKECAPLNTLQWTHHITHEYAR